MRACIHTPHQHPCSWTHEHTCTNMCIYRHMQWTCEHDPQSTITRVLRHTHLGINSHRKHTRTHPDTFIQMYRALTQGTHTWAPGHGHAQPYTVQHSSVKPHTTTYTPQTHSDQQNCDSPSSMDVAEITPLSFLGDHPQCRAACSRYCHPWFYNSQIS